MFCSTFSAEEASARCSRCGKQACALHFARSYSAYTTASQAYDVDENRYVACKIHQLVPQWTEEHKRSYVRHAVRTSAARLYAVSRAHDATAVRHESIAS